MKTKSILILLTVFLISNSAALAATVKGERAKHLNDVLTAISRTAPDAISWGDCSMGKCILEVHKVKCENKSKDKNSEATCSLIAIAGRNARPRPKPIKKLIPAEPAPNFLEFRIRSS